MQPTEYLCARSQWPGYSIVSNEEGSMPTKVKASVATFVVVFGMACGDQSVTAPGTNRLSPEASALTTRTDNGQKQEVTGGAVFLVGSERNVFAGYGLSAIRHTDGRISGQVEIRSNIDGGFRIHGEVACFTIVNNA